MVIKALAIFLGINAIGQGFNTEPITKVFELAGIISGGGVKRSLPSSEYHESLVRSLSSAGLQYDAVEHLDISSMNLQKRNRDAPDLTHRTMIRGVQFGSYTHDFALNHFTNGGSDIYLGSGNETLHEDPTSERSKRAEHHNRGVKISFLRQKKMDLDQRGVTALSHGIGKQWGETAFSQTGFSSLIGYILDKDNNKVLSYRISSEMKEFDDDYDDVNICGNSA